MAEFDFQSPNARKVELSKFGFNSKDVYYVSYYEHGEIFTKKVKLLNKCFEMVNHNWSEVYRVKTDWIYLYETKNFLGKKTKHEIIFKSDSSYMTESLNLDLIGKSLNESKLKFILSSLRYDGLHTPAKVTLNSELAKHKILEPTLYERITSTPFIERHSYEFSNMKKYFKQ